MEAIVERTSRPATAAPPARARHGHPRPKRGKRPLLIAVAAFGIILLATAIATLSGSLGDHSQTLIFHTAKKTDLPITVTERGNLESQQNIDVFCEVDDIEGDNVHGTPILSIVANGSAVKKGDLLVELDSANHRERLDRQILATQKARAEEIKAKALYENQITQNATSYAEGELQVKLAELALEQFEDEEGGTFQISLQDVELQIQEAEAGQLIEKTNLEGVEQLYELGYRSSGELAQAQLSALKTKRQLAAAVAKKRELVAYQYKKSRMELEGHLASAKRSLQQIERDNEAYLQQAKAAMENAQQALAKEEERLNRYRKQVELCKIYAPADGMIAYNSSRSRYWEEIREGASVRPRQKILTLPSLNKMQVQTAVHESVLDQTRPGLPVTVRVDAFPDRSYKGSVKSVAVLPDQSFQFGSDTKVYETVITIDEEVAQLKPGMTAVVEIHIDHLENVLCVPVQAIVQRQDETWIYVSDGGALERRDVELGQTNDKFVEITSGLAEGEQVVLNPMALTEEGRSEEPESAPSTL